ncbi:MAG: DUF58 domain-containing protein [Planctomycetes bacterium]|nr:DUF58 domain-containing protein [Planctomycetota bacterium]
MPRPSPEAHALAERYRLALLETPTRGVMGERMGRGVGSSLEFQDRRAYSVGDDVRHLDWRAFARTDQFYVRQYREEILPRVDLVLDASRSMGHHADKAQLAVDLAVLLAESGRADGLHVNVLRAGDRPAPVPIERLADEGVEFDGRTPLAATLAELSPLLRPDSLRVLVSDFLFPHEPRALLQPLADRGGGLAVVQVLAREERTPSLSSALRLVDCEDDATLDLVVDRVTIERYVERLERLSKALEEEARRLGARHAQLVAGAPLAAACRDVLVPARIVAPA